MTCVTWSRALALAAGLAGFAALGAPTAALADSTLNFCNKTGAKIFIAVAYQDAQTGRWILSAWHTRNPGQCASIGTVKTGLFYYYAEKEGRTWHWPASDSVEKTYCVPPTAVKREMAGSACGPNERHLGFRGRVIESQTYTFSFS